MTWQLFWAAVFFLWALFGASKRELVADQLRALRTVARTGESAPGFTNRTFRSLDTPVLSHTELSAFLGAVTDPFITPVERGIWAEGPNGLRIVARSGQEAPGTNGRTFELLEAPYVLDNGGAMVFAWVGGTEPFDQRFGIWTDRDGALTKIIRGGDAIPGNAEGLSVRQVAFPAASAFGVTAVETLLSGPGVTPSNERAIWREQQGAWTKVARAGDPAVGTESGTAFANVQGASISRQGVIGFIGELAGPSVNDTNDIGLWIHGAQGSSLAVREGQLLSFSGRTGRLSGGLGHYHINSAGHVGFDMELVGENIPANTFGQFTTRGGSLEAVSIEGERAPVTGDVVFESFEGPAQINELGHVAFRANLDGPDRRGDRDQAIWFSGSPGNRILVARYGDVAPGAVGDVRFSNFPEPILAADGDVIVIAQLEGTGVTAGNALGVYRWATDRGLELVFRHGDQVEVSPGQFKTIRETSMFGSNLDGRYRSESDDAIAFRATFTDGSQAIVIVPEPSSLVTMSLGALLTLGAALLRNSKRKRTAPRI